MGGLASASDGRSSGRLRLDGLLFRLAAGLERLAPGLRTEIGEVQDRIRIGAKALLQFTSADWTSVHEVRAIVDLDQADVAAR